MNKRKLKRAKGVTSKKATRSADMIITQKAKEIARCATSRKPKIDCVGNFIFFATETGEAWLIDHRDGRALRLADGFKVLPYKIEETKERFRIQWTERYEIEDGVFTAYSKESSSVYKDYPTKTIQGLIDMLKQKESAPPLVQE